MHRGVVMLLLTLGAISGALGQELNITVRVNDGQVQTSDRSVFRDMEKAFANFLNSRRWTSDNYRSHEKIKATLFLNITAMPAIGSFVANAQITSARPIYNSSYESVLFNFADRNWDFEYIESLPLQYNDNTYTSNLTSLLAFYAYIVLGMDYDSFSELGGTSYFQKALVVVNNAQSSGRSGWQALDGTRNRYALVEDLNNPQMIELRKNTYRYHRLGMDVFEKNPAQTRQVTLDALTYIKDVWALYPSSIFIISFFDAKSAELINIFSKGTLSVRRQAYELLAIIDPKRNSYQKIIAN